MQPDGIPGELKVGGKPAQVVAASQAELSRSIKAGVSLKTTQLGCRQSWVDRGSPMPIAGYPS